MKNINRIYSNLVTRECNSSLRQANNCSDKVGELKIENAPCTPHCRRGLVQSKSVSHFSSLSPQTTSLFQPKIEIGAGCAIRRPCFHLWLLEECSIQVWEARPLNGSWHDAALSEISHPDKITDGFMIVAHPPPPLLFANAQHANVGHGTMPKTNGSQLQVDKIHWIGEQFGTSTAW